ncbi:hypothetical protein Nepgr_023830 [Nepenthes gracilis]|uniref:F-box protein At3g26010-like beta-propeller domain-containing protein n=1 Tax=Nepenthes gracilis TaxID=150966 RepID=A0AAD3XY21_NEPGR|nr:hypothetical protein Nepgr_023830 [Nepenthes gracilis]
MAFNDDQIYELFSWLPVKSLRRFASISKHCNGFLYEPSFIRLQSHHVMLKAAASDEGYFVQSKYGAKWSFLPSSAVDFASTIVPLDSLKFLKEQWLRIISSSNGLLLCVQTATYDPDSLYVVNPATGTWTTIPAPEEVKEMLRHDSYSDYGLGIVFECCDCDIDFPDDYLLMAVSGFGLIVYSSTTRAWEMRHRFVVGGNSYLRRDNHVYLEKVGVHFLCDKLHFPAIRPHIMAFNPSEGTMKLLKIPRDASRRRDVRSWSLRIFRWNGNSCNAQPTISLVRLKKKKHFKIWVLEDYDSCFWAEVLNVRVKVMAVEEVNPVVAGYAITGGTWLIFATTRYLYKYNLKDEDFQKVEVIGCHGIFDPFEFSEYCTGGVDIIPYSSTLRPPGTEPVAVVGHPT